MKEDADRYPYSPPSTLPGSDWHAETVGSQPGTENHNGIELLGDPMPRNDTPSSW